MYLWVTDSWDDFLCSFAGEARLMDKEANFPKPLFRWGNQSRVDQKHAEFREEPE